MTGDDQMIGLDERKCAAPYLQVQTAAVGGAFHLSAECLLIMTRVPVHTHCILIPGQATPSLSSPAQLEHLQGIIYVEWN
jgi:hypothetical protein